MSEQSIVQFTQKQKTTALVIGGTLGALVGLAGAYLLAQNAERDQKPVNISPGEGVKLAVLVLGLLRSIATLHE
ncbi:MAG: hypothetical protein H6Q38_2102 [Chloroflexi bacterium]|jgi:hypothetical protein|nr:hypothetical protein [Chloroflexota bacterium]